MGQDSRFSRKHYSLPVLLAKHLRVYSRALDQASSLSRLDKTLRKMGLSDRAIAALRGREEFFYSGLLVSGTSAVLTYFFSVDAFWGTLIGSALSLLWFLADHRQSLYLLDGILTHAPPSGLTHTQARSRAFKTHLLFSLSVRLIYMIALHVFSLNQLHEILITSLFVGAIHGIVYNAGLAPAFKLALAMAGGHLSQTFKRDIRRDIFPISSLSGYLFFPLVSNNSFVRVTMGNLWMRLTHTVEWMPSTDGRFARFQARADKEMNRIRTNMNLPPRDRAEWELVTNSRSTETYLGRKMVPLAVIKESVTSPWDILRAQIGAVFEEPTVYQVRGVALSAINSGVSPTVAAELARAVAVVARVPEEPRRLRDYAEVEWDRHRFPMNDRSIRDRLAAFLQGRQSVQFFDLASRIDSKDAEIQREHLGKFLENYHVGQEKAMVLRVLEGQVPVGQREAYVKGEWDHLCHLFAGDREIQAAINSLPLVLVNVRENDLLTETRLMEAARPVLKLDRMENYVPVVYSVTNKGWALAVCLIRLLVDMRAIPFIPGLLKGKQDKGLYLTYA